MEGVWVERASNILVNMGHSPSVRSPSGYRNMLSEDCGHGTKLSEKWKRVSLLIAIVP